MQLAVTPPICFNLQRAIVEPRLVETVFLNRLHIKRYGVVGAILLAGGLGAFSIGRDFIFPWYLQHESMERQAEQQAEDDSRQAARTEREERDRRNREAAEAEKIRLLGELVAATKKQAEIEAVQQIRRKSDMSATEPARKDQGRKAGNDNLMSPDKPTNADDGIEAQAAEAGLRSFSVIGDKKFDLCGYADFSVTARAGRATLHSTDRSIPQRAFGGWEKTVTVGEKADIMGECSVVIQPRTAAGIGYFIISEFRPGRAR